MFSLKMIEEVVKDSDVLAKYEEYCNVVYSLPKERQPNILRLRPWVMNIANGETNGFRLKPLVLGVIEAATYTYSHTLNEHIKIANEDVYSKLENSDLSQEAKDYLIKFNKTVEEEISEKEKLEEVNFSIEEQFAIANINSQIDKMSVSQLQNSLKELHVLLRRERKQFAYQIKQQWGL